MANVKPWERQEGETNKQFEAFAIYRDMGQERSLRKVAERLKKSETLMGRWSGSNKWVDRAGAWDTEQDRLNRIEQQKEIAKMRKRHAKIAVAMLEKSLLAMKTLEAEDMNASDIARFVSEASKLERISRGDVGDVVEEREGVAAADPVQIYIPDNKRSTRENEFDDLEL